MVNTKPFKGHLVIRLKERGQSRCKRSEASAHLGRAADRLRNLTIWVAARGFRLHYQNMEIYVYIYIYTSINMIVRIVTIIHMMSEPW